MQLCFKTLAAICSVAVSLNTGCSRAPYVSEGSGSSGGDSPPMFSDELNSEEFAPAIPAEEDFIPAESSGRSIALSGDEAAISGSGAEYSDGIVTISENGTYGLSGSSDSVRFAVTAPEVSLILDGLSVCPSAGAAIEHSGGRLTLSLTGGENHLCGSAAVSTDGSLLINGSGSLSIDGDSGLVCRGDILLCGGNVEINAAEDGISGGAALLLAEGSVGIRAGGDGIRLHDNDAAAGYFSMSGGILDIKAAADGIRTRHGIFLSDGDMKIVCGGGSSAVIHLGTENGSYARHGGFYTDGASPFDFDGFISGDGSKAGSKKGLRTDGIIKITGGSADIDSADDSIAAGGSFAMNQGSLRLRTGDDGVHSDGSVDIDGGILRVEHSYSAVEGMSVDISSGELSLKSLHDGINAAGGNDVALHGSINDGADRYIGISGGEVMIDAGGDGVDSGGTAAMSGGTLIISAPDEGSSPISYRDSFAVSGGVLAAFGSENATGAPGIVSGCCISVYADIGGGETFSVLGDEGEVFSVVPSEDFGSVIFFSPELISGRAYSLYSDDKLLSEIIVAEGIRGGGPNGRGGKYDDILGNSGQDGATVA